MGAPSAPAVIQQTAKPSQSEKEAAADALKQKQDALAVIRQDVFARSQGLRGAASMYDYAGKTPWLAKDPTAQTPTDPTTAAKPPAAKPPPNLWGKSNTTIGPVNDFAHNPFPLDPNDARGPAGDRDPGNRTIGGAPKNTGAVPGGPVANRPIGGSPQQTGQSHADVIAHDPIAYAKADPALAAKLAQTKAAMGLTPKPPTPTAPNGGLPTDPGAAGRAKLGLTPKTPPTIDPHQTQADSAVKPAPTTMLPNQGTIAAKLGIMPGPAAAVGGGTASGALAKPVTAPAPATKTTAPTPVQANLGTPKLPAPPPAKPPTLATPAPKLTGIVRPTTPQPLSLVNRGSGGNR